MVIKECNDPTIPEGKSKTYGVFKDINDDEPICLISLNSKDDKNLNLDQDELVIWTPEEGTEYSRFI